MKSTIMVAIIGFLVFRKSKQKIIVPVPELSPEFVSERHSAFRTEIDPGVSRDSRYSDDNNYI